MAWGSLRDEVEHAMHYTVVILSGLPSELSRPSANGIL
jgi:hypothetical protein